MINMYETRRICVPFYIYIFFIILIPFDLENFGVHVESVFESTFCVDLNMLTFCRVCFRERFLQLDSEYRNLFFTIFFR